MSIQNTEVLDSDYDLDTSILTYHQLVQLRRKEGIIKPPDFIGVGAGRCGTTTIYETLKSHPKIKLSPVKELNYFGIFDLHTNKKSGLTFKEYQTYFATEKVDLLRGEISPAYITRVESLKQIKKHVPNVKIIITLRNHFERFFSQYKHHQKKSGFEDFNSYCKEALSYYEDSFAPNGWFTPWKNLNQSLYFNGLRFISRNFDSSQVHLSLFNDLVLSSGDECNKICKFLGLTTFAFEEICANKSKKIDMPSIDIGIKRRLDDIFAADLDSSIKLFPKLEELAKK